MYICAHVYLAAIYLRAYVGVRRLHKYDFLPQKIKSRQGIANGLLVLNTILCPHSNTGIQTHDTDMDMYACKQPSFTHPVAKYGPPNFVRCADTKQHRQNDLHSRDE